MLSYLIYYIIIYYIMCLYILASQIYSLIYMIICNIYDYLKYNYILDNIFLYFTINGYYIVLCYILYINMLYICVFI